jgi:6-phosphogluconolactonase
MSLPNRQILVFENSFKITNYLLKRWMDIAQQSIKERGRFTVALSGGKTPLEFYCRLSGIDDMKLWSNTHLFQADERFVSQDSPESNFKMISDNILSYAGIPASNVHPIHTNVKSLETSIEEYDKDLRSFFKNENSSFPSFDLIFLGVGEDGHTASIFPGTQAIDEASRWVVGTNTSDVKHQRISLSLPLINHARHVFILVLGSSKASIMKNILIDQKKLPAGLIRTLNGQVTFCLDKDAASQIPYRTSYVDHGDAIIVNV